MVCSIQASWVSLVSRIVSTFQGFFSGLRFCPTLSVVTITYTCCTNTGYLQVGSSRLSQGWSHTHRQWYFNPSKRESVNHREFSDSSSVLQRTTDVLHSTTLTEPATNGMKQSYGTLHNSSENYTLEKISLQSFFHTTSSSLRIQRKAENCRHVGVYEDSRFHGNLGE